MKQGQETNHIWTQEVGTHDTNSINYHINYCAPLAPTAGALFTPNTILLHIILLFKNCCFNYLKQN